MGGAIADVDPEATAFAERGSPYMISIDGMWEDPAADERTIGWIRQTWDEVSRFGTGGVYLNFTGLAGEAPSARRGQRLRPQPEPAGEGEGDLRPGQLLPGEQQHQAGVEDWGRAYRRGLAVRVNNAISSRPAVAGTSPMKA